MSSLSSVHPTFTLHPISLYIQNYSNPKRKRAEATRKKRDKMEVRMEIISDRRTANYTPNSWDYYSFSSLQNNFDEPHINSFYEETKEQIRSELMCKGSDQLAARLSLIDVLHRLGVATHFSEEIKHILEEIVMDNAKETLKNDFASLALLFKIMRENSYYVTQDILNSITNENIQNDAKGLLSLYNASFLELEGEEALKESRIFCTKQLLKLDEISMDKKIKVQVEHDLEIPLHWRVPRLETRWFINQCRANENVDSMLTKFAGFYYNEVQLLHREELSKLSRWWMEIGLSEKLPFARNRLVEACFYGTGIAPEPHHAHCREVLCKLAALIIILDDVFDVYGTLDELSLFTEAIQRWDSIKAAKELPEYMRTLYNVIFNTTKEIASYVHGEHGWDATQVLVKSWRDACDSFLTEAKWHQNGYIPNFEEYLENGWVSSTAPVLLTHAFTVLGDKTTQFLNLEEKYPRLIQSCATILRLTNDCATHHVEVKRGDAPSSIACYMNEHLCTEGQAREAIENRILVTWRKINEDSFGHDCDLLPRSFINTSVNLTRMSHCLYTGGDGIGAPNQRMKGLMRSLLLDSISID